MLFIFLNLRLVPYHKGERAFRYINPTNIHKVETASALTNKTSFKVVSPPIC